MQVLLSLLVLVLMLILVLVPDDSAITIYDDNSANTAVQYWNRTGWNVLSECPADIFNGIAIDSPILWLH